MGDSGGGSGEAPELRAEGKKGNHREGLRLFPLAPDTISARQRRGKSSAARRHRRSEQEHAEWVGVWSAANKAQERADYAYAKETEKGGTEFQRRAAVTVT